MPKSKLGLALRPLARKERLHLCSFVRALIPVARDGAHPMRELARREIALTLWRWTADAVLSSPGAADVVKQDAYKYNTTVHAATRSAKDIAASGAGERLLRHEHAVPRAALSDRIVQLDLPVDGIFELLDRYCVAAIVTVEEDRKLRPKNKMPPGWSWEGGDPYERYVYSSLDRELERPCRRRDG